MENIKPILEAFHKNLRLIIDGEYREGAYLYIYKNGSQDWDYLQDNIEICKQQALEDFEVPVDSWHEYKGEIQSDWNYYYHLKNLKAEQSFFFKIFKIWKDFLRR